MSRGGPKVRFWPCMAPLSANPACAAASRGDYARNDQIRPIPSPRSPFRDSQRLLHTVESFGTGFRMLGFAIWVFGTRCWVFGTGSWVFGTTYWMLGTQCWVSGSAVGEITTWCKPPTPNPPMCLRRSQIPVFMSTGVNRTNSFFAWSGQCGAPLKCNKVASLSESSALLGLELVGCGDSADESN